MNAVNSPENLITISSEAIAETASFKYFPDTDISKLSSSNFELTCNSSTALPKSLACEEISQLPSVTTNLIISSLSSLLISEILSTALKNSLLSAVNEHSNIVGISFSVFG